jgi:hypothetical protein
MIIYYIDDKATQSKEGGGDKKLIKSFASTPSDDLKTGEESLVTSICTNGVILYLFALKSLPMGQCSMFIG